MPGLHPTALLIPLAYIAIALYAGALIYTNYIGLRIFKGKRVASGAHRRSANVTLGTMFLVALMVEVVGMAYGVHPRNALFWVHLSFALLSAALLISLRFLFTGKWNRKVHPWIVAVFDTTSIIMLLTGLELLSKI